MKRGILILVGASLCAAALMLFAPPSLSTETGRPPWNGCVAISKQEYDSAKKQNLLQTRFSTYVRTGRLARRFYWYCHS